MATPRQVTPAVCKAVREKRLLSIEYHGGERLVEPYLHGFAADGREILVAFQRGGASSSGAESGWKAFIVADLVIMETIDVPFVRARPDYHAGYSKNITEVHCQV